MSFKPRPKGSKTTSRGARHSKESPEWFTPAPFAEAAREVMGGIDIDPASCEQANKVVRARIYYDQESDGLVQPWGGRVFLNPPGGLVKPFWAKLVESFMLGHTEQAIWIGYSLEQLQTLQNIERHDMPGHFWSSPQDYRLCFPRRRIAFVFPDRPDRKSPTHANYICYLGSRWGAFSRAFSQFGWTQL